MINFTSVDDLYNFINDDEVGKILIKIQDDLTQEAFNFPEYIDKNLNLETAEGYWLDLIGLWVGQSRIVPFAIAKLFYGTREQPFTQQPRQGVLGRIRRQGESVTESGELSDQFYRVAIKVRIMQNKGDTTLPSIARSLVTLFNTTDIRLTNEAGKVTARIGRPITIQERTLIDALNLPPVMGGVDFEYIGINENGY